MYKRSLQLVQDYSRFLLAGVVLILLAVGVAAASQPEKQMAEKADPVQSTQTPESNQQISSVSAATRSTTGTTSTATEAATASTAQSASTTSSKTTQKDGNRESLKSKLADLRLSADSVVVWDMRANEIIHSRNARSEQPLASLTKLMTALVARRLTPGEDTRKVITIREDHLDASGRYGLKTNQQWTLKNLLSFLLVESANDAARAIARAVPNTQGVDAESMFVDRMNRTATQLGLEDTYFFNPSGLDINEELISGGYGTAYDMVRLFDYVATNHPDLLKPTIRESLRLSTVSNQVLTAENTNPGVDTYEHVIGSKTGFTELAGGNLMMGFDLERPVVVAVLGSSREGRFTDMQKIYQTIAERSAIANQ